MLWRCFLLHRRSSISGRFNFLRDDDDDDDDDDYDIN